MLLWFTIGLAGERPGVILADSSHPLVLACTEAVGASRLTECVERTARRDAAAAEVAACGQFGEPKFVNDCMVRLERRRKHDASPAISACAEVFGKLGMACARTTELALGDAESTVRACREISSDEKRALACISQFNETRFSAGASIQACQTLNDASEKCLARVAGAAGPMENVLTYCRSQYSADGDALKCAVRFAGSTVDAAPGIKACHEVLPAQEKCLDTVARASTDLEGVIRACRSTFSDEREAVGCVSGFAESRFEQGPAVLACGTKMGEYSQECIDRIGRAAAPMGGIVEACGDGLEGKQAMKCVAMLVERRKAKGESVAKCMSLFDDPGERLKCAEVAHHRDAEKMEKCRSWENNRINCVVH